MDRGRSKHLRGLLGFILLGTLWGPAEIASASQSPSPPVILSQLLRGVEGKYNRLKTMKARFHQIYRQGGGIVRQEHGVLYLSKPGRMRWEYESPETKLFVTDGKRAILFVPAENRVMETAIKESEDIKAPLAFLLGRLKFDEQFERMETSPQFIPVEKGDFVFKAYSKKMAERLEWVLFEVHPASFEIRRIVARERGGLETEFRFDAMQSNPALAAGLFQFTAPTGAEVVRE
jgi:outer membrane lipoprotein carrier protein